MASPPNSGISAGTGVLALAPPEIPGVDPLDPTGLIPASLMLADLKVLIPQWGPAPEPLDTPHTLTWYWLKGGSVVYSNSIPINAPPPPLPIKHVVTIPLVVLRASSGIFEFYYSVTDSFGGKTDLDPKITLTVDMDNPQLLNPADRLSFVVPPLPFDETYAQNNDPVAFHLPAYTGRSDKDKIHFYLSNSSNPPVAGEDATYELVSSSDPLIVYIDADKFRTLLNGVAYIFHRIFDEAGNFSDRSAGLPFQLALIPLPGPLPSPEIFPPSLYIDSLIKRDDARAGIFVRINTYTNWAPGDKVLVFWKGRPAPIQDVLGFPTDVRIDWSVSRGPLTEPLAAETVPVRYQIIRASLPPFPSFAIPVNVNYTLAGHDHFNAPALLNLDLPIAEVWGLVSNTRNVVNHNDNPAGARARVLLYKNPQPGEILRFFWNGIGPVATYTVVSGDVEGQLVFSSVIPWAVMMGFIHPALPVYYTTSNGVNEQQSDNAFVNVNTGTLLSFPAPALKHTLTGSGGGYLSCCSKPEIFFGVEWHVLPDPAFQLGDEIEYRWVGYDNNNWSPPVIPGSEYDEMGTFNNGNDLANGLKFIVKPYDEKLYPMRDFGTALACYRVRRGGVLIGESLPRKIRVDLNYSTPGYCKAGDVISCSNSGVATLVSSQ
ncbi:hypothetical protein ACSSUR_22300 [Pseudomonas cedrina]|uniref:hypothetical protein n=1 Tax=Pseudomonas cedrina TaxID=651740 RepID=UPI003ED89CF1